jgi:hypothetical protein
MIQSLPSEVLRFILRSVREIPESKWQIIYLALFIRISNGSFTSYWLSLTQSPKAPFMPRMNRAFVLPAASLGAQCIIILLMWRLFRRQQIHLSSPWKDIDTNHILQLLPAWSAFRGLHSLMMRFGSQRSSVIRAKPWHFKQTLVLTYAGSVLWAATKSGGLEAVLTEVHNTIQVDLYHLMWQQASAAWQQPYKSSITALDYRHKPRFAWAAVLQAYPLLLLKLLPWTKSSSLVAVLSYTVPVTSVATLLLFAAYGHGPDYLNASILDRGVFVARTSVFCETCKNTAISSSKRDHTRDKQHHLTTASLQRSAESRCRICAILWERRTRILKDFVKDLKYWEPVTTYERHMDSLIFNFKQDCFRAQPCRFWICKAQGQ